MNPLRWKKLEPGHYRAVGHDLDVLRVNPGEWQATEGPAGARSWISTTATKRAAVEDAERSVRPA